MEDSDVFISANHPDLWNAASPATSAAIEAIASKREKEREIEEEDPGGEGDSVRMSPKKRKLSHLISACSRCLK